jgi:hypothetical protein
MWEKLQHNVDRESEEPVNNLKLDRQLKKKKTARQCYNKKFTLMDLLKIFTDEADKICENKAIANLIALESLRDYIENHVSNIKVIS